MYLSQITLNPFSRRVQGLHRTAYQTHRSILRSFHDPLPDHERVLFRREEVNDPPILRLLVQSRSEPDWKQFMLDHQGGLLDDPKVKVYDPMLYVGQILSFRLQANPTVKRDGRRLGLLREPEQINWLLHKGENGGFRADPGSLRITKRGFERDTSANGQSMTVLCVQYDGLLMVENAERFRETLDGGIGSAKGLGCGLLSIAPVV